MKTALDAAGEGTVDGGDAREAEGAPAATIILPAYNEGAALPLVLTSLFAVLDDSCDDSCEVIVVDDGSTDATAAIASAFPCRLLRHKRNYGKGVAVRTGLLAARGRFIIAMDADNTYPAEAIPTMIALSKQYDFVRCVRRDGVGNSPLVNRFGSWFFDLVLRAAHGLPGADHLSGLYGLRREAFDAIQLTASRFDLEIEIAIKARARRLRTISLPIRYGARLGDKKLSAWRDGRAILRLAVLMALLYNPGLVFVLPGVLIWLLAAVMMLILGQGSIMTPYVGRLDVNSFIVAALGATIGFQFVVFGVVAALFGVERGARPGRWLVAASHSYVRLWTGLVGMACCLLGGFGLASRIGTWLLAGGGTFSDTRHLVLSGVLLSWGVELVLAVLFISIFASRLGREQRGAPVVELASDQSTAPSKGPARPAVAGIGGAEVDEWGASYVGADRGSPHRMR